MKKSIISLITAAILSTSMYAQEFKMPSPSTFSTINQQFSISSIEIEYSRPSMKGRKVFGDMIPYGKIWRTGANANTKISFGEDVMIEGMLLPAGKYSVYTIPNKDSWEIVFNKGLENWGTSGYNDAEDALRVKVKPITSKQQIETFSIDVNNITNNSATIFLSWENTIVPIKVVANNHDKIIAYLDQELAGSKPPYQQAANYYLEQNYKLDQALVYADKAIESNQNAFWLQWMKAKILNKLGRKVEAIEAATKAAEMSKGTGYEAEYTKNLSNLKKGLVK